MATITTTGGSGRGLLDRLISNRLLAALSAALFTVAVVAIIRGRTDWPAIPGAVWFHLLSILVATALTPVMLLRPKGDRSHRKLGYIWVTAMILTAASSLFVHRNGDGSFAGGVFAGHFSPIHVLSAWVLFQVPRLVMQARRHDRLRHERSIRGIVIGALLVAGFFTFPFNRLLGTWLFA